jgi:ribosomal protein S18 acetylase RimI-like enzyme
MNTSRVRLNTSDAATIELHLRQCDERFNPRLSSRVDLGNYAKKLALFSDRFEAWQEGRLVGLIAAYLNNSESRRGFISSVSICSDFEGRGLASELMQKCIQLARDKGRNMLELEVSEIDKSNQAFYRKHRFGLSGKGTSGFLRMELGLIKQ